MFPVVKPIRITSCHPQYRLRTTSLKGNIVLDEYLSKYPLFGSKYLDYKDWLKVLSFFKLGKPKKRSKEEINEILYIKSNMNDRRNFFIWNHLQKFYNLGD